jgi:RNA polymerase sigma-54 factor
MRLTQTVEARQQQTQRIDPRQILASEILAWNIAELEAAVDRELAENPALEARDGETFAPTVEAPAPSVAREAPPGLAAAPAVSPTPAGTVSSNLAPMVIGDDDDPLERMASQQSLRDHLRQQAGQVPADVPGEVVRYLIENVDERGYLVADAREVAERFRVTRPDVEAAIQALQTMDPAGVGARDLRECLLLQAEFLDQAGEGNPLARRILQQCWEELVAHRTERIASRLKVHPKEVHHALAFLQRALTPYPGASFRPIGNRGGAPPVRPDIVFHRTESGFLVELPRDFEHALLIAPLWKRLAEHGESGTDEAMRRYIKDHVERAQTFLSGVERRGRTLRAIARELARHQMGFLETRDRAFLKPLTRQALAETLKLDESVISRAVADKWAQLPSGEVIPLDAFFGNSHAVREALAGLVATEDPQNPYSDDELADILTEQGFPLARRTVAKYRGLERILPARLRKRNP